MPSRIIRWTREQWPLNSILFIFLLQILTDILQVIYSASKRKGGYGVHKIVMLAMVAIICGVSGLGVNDTRGEDYERGKALFNEKCQLCHGVKGDGNGPAAAAYNPQPAKFTDPKFWKDNPGKKITDAMKSGYRAMPPVDVKADEIKAIIDYMEHAFKK